MVGTGTKVIIICLLINTCLVLIDPNFQAVKLPSTFESLATNPQSVTPSGVDYLSLFITVPVFIFDVAVAPIQLTVAEGLPIYVKMFVGIPLATLYIMALFAFFRGRWL